MLECAMRRRERRKLGRRLTKLLLDDLEYLLLVKFLGKSLDSRQSLTTITLYHGPGQLRLPDAKGNLIIGFISIGQLKSNVR